MKRKNEFRRKAFCVLAILLLVLCFATNSLAAGEFRAEEGNGWNLTADGVLTIESNTGWQDYLRNGSTEVINKLVIGKKLTELSLFDDSTNEFVGSNIACPRFQPKQIEVEDGNPTFILEDGLLIDTSRNTVTSSELSVRDVVIPDGVQKIGAFAFYRREIDTIQFPSSLKRIEAFAFSGCKNLETLVFPDTLSWIGDLAFYKCSSVKEIWFSNNLEYIGEGAFSDCSIRELILPDNIQEIGVRCFEDCQQLEMVRFSANLKTIRYQTFKECTSLQDVDLSEGLETIGAEAFLGCENLKKISLPETLSEIGADAFQNLDFDLVEFPDTLKAGDSAFGRIHVAVFNGSNYEFSDRSIDQVDIMLFLNNPPQGISKLNADSLFPKVYYTEPFAGAWKAGVTNGLNGWPTKCISLEEADDLIAQAVATPEPQKEPTTTTDVLGLFSNTPEPNIQPEANAGTDPLVYVFAGLLALVAAGIVVVGVRARKKQRRKPARKG